MNFERIINIIDKYEYISFDIFDTLIKRNVKNPADIFSLTEMLYYQNTGRNIENYREERIVAERKAKEIKMDREPNIDEIFAQLDIKEDIRLLKEFELELEFKLCQKNVDFYPIYEYCKNTGKKIVIISDMYLNKNHIKHILEKNEINKYNYLFISNEVKLNKHNGKIYPYVLKKLNIKSNRILHIGDSKRSDYFMAKMHGINPILIPKRIDNLSYYNKIERLDIKDKFDYEQISTFINNNIPKHKDQYYKIGYEVLGILLYSYSKWLLKNLKERNINKIFFLAREGALLKEAFEMIKDENIECKYLYVSRRSTRVCLLRNINNLEDVFSIVKMRKIIDLKSFFINVGLEIENYEKILNKYNCGIETNIDKIKNFESLFEDIKQDIINNAKIEEEKLLGYLLQEDFCDKIAIADVGWVGTMQHALNSILKEHQIKLDITRLLYGTIEFSKRLYRNWNENGSILI